jgi:pimeloyl-ACP methyl ester carboxylesterase
MAEKTFRIGAGRDLIGGAETGDGPPLLMLHGGPGLSDYLTILAGETAGFRAVRYQQRGIGPSTLDGPFTVIRHVADAVAVLDDLGIGRCLVLGHSWGAHLALQLAVAAPGRVDGLVLIDGLGVADPDGGTAAVGQQLIARTPEATLARLQELAGSGLPLDDAATEQTRLLWPAYFAEPAQAPPPPDALRVSAAVNQETAASVAESLAAGFAGRLGEVTVPAVVVLGGRSPMPLPVGEQVASLLPAAETIVIPEGGHLPWHERPGCVAAALASVQSRAAATPA